MTKNFMNFKIDKDEIIPNIAIKEEKYLIYKKCNCHFLGRKTSILKTGKWNKDEHERFLKACYFYKNNWNEIVNYIKTRSLVQIRSHAQKYLIKLCKKYKIKLSAKKFKNKDSKHLSRANEKICEKNFTISEMNEMDKNIIKLFNYYNRDWEGIGEDKLNNWLDESSKHPKIKFHTIKKEDRDLNLNKNDETEFEFLEEAKYLSNTKSRKIEHDSKQEKHKKYSIDRLSRMETINSNSHCKINSELNVNQNLSSNIEQQIFLENNHNSVKFLNKNFNKENYSSVDINHYFENKKTPEINIDALCNHKIAGDSIHIHTKYHSIEQRNFNSLRKNNYSEDIFLRNNSSYSFSKQSPNSLLIKNENIPFSIVKLNEIQTKNVSLENNDLDFIVNKNQKSLLNIQNNNCTNSGIIANKIIDNPMIRFDNQLAEIIEFNNKSLNLLKNDFKIHLNNSPSDNESDKIFHSNNVTEIFNSINVLWHKYQNETNFKTFIFKHIKQLDLILSLDDFKLRYNINVNQYIENSNYFWNELIRQMNLNKIIKDNDLISL